MNDLQSAPSSSVFLSTTALPMCDRLPVWREVFGQTLVKLDIEPVKDAPFYAEGELCALPGAAFASVTASPVCVTRTQRHIADDAADMVFVVTADVPLHITQCGREHVLDAGDAIFLRGGESSVIRWNERAQFTNISVPVDDLTPMLANRDDVSMTVVSRQNDVLNLLVGYVNLLQARKDPWLDKAGRLAAAHIRDLMATMIGGEPDHDISACEHGGVRAARLRGVKADISAHLCEPDLSIDVIAVRHGISPRYVRKLFQEQQTTFSDFVLSLRLEWSLRLLRSPEQTVCTITAIAQAVGFSDMSYFNRTFRRRFGITPSDFRHGVPVLSADP